jgi:hypothetical protein
MNSQERNYRFENLSTTLYYNPPFSSVLLKWHLKFKHNTYFIFHVHQFYHSLINIRLFTAFETLKSNFKSYLVDYQHSLFYDSAAVAAIFKQFYATLASNRLDPLLDWSFTTYSDAFPRSIDVEDIKQYLQYFNLILFLTHIPLTFLREIISIIDF